jgi:hypothetical protein
MPRVIAADSWYRSGTAWGAIGAAAGVIAVIVALATLRVMFLDPNQRRLYYQLARAAPLLAAGGAARTKIEVRHDGHLMTHPMLVEIRLIGRSRKDVPNASFNAGEPLTIDLGQARIVDVLDVTADTGAVPPHSALPDTTCLKIGPGLIRRRQVITWTLLTDGPRPTLTCRSPLIDVDVHERANDQPGTSPPPWLWSALYLAVVVVVFAAVVAAAAVAVSPGVAVEVAVVVAAALVAVVVAAALVVRFRQILGAPGRGDH